MVKNRMRMTEMTAK